MLDSPPSRARLGRAGAGELVAERADGGLVGGRLSGGGDTGRVAVAGTVSKVRLLASVDSVFEVCGEAVPGWLPAAVLRDSMWSDGVDF